ncbi:unnamed protein product [Boreogadus saida]
MRFSSERIFSRPIQTEDKDSTGKVESPAPKTPRPCTSRFSPTQRSFACPLWIGLVCFACARRLKSQHLQSGAPNGARMAEDDTVTAKSLSMLGGMYGTAP